MATVQVHEGQSPLSRRTVDEKTVQEVAMTGSMVEGVGGVGAIVLAIVALTGVLPLTLTSIAAIALGAAIVFEGLASMARFSRLLAEESEATRWARAEGEGGMSLELFCGAAGGVLGILSLIRIAPMILLPIAAIVFGVGLIFGSGARARLARQMLEGSHGYDFMSLIAREAMQAARFVEIGIGIGGAVLGILALVGNSPLVLTQVAMLAFGAAVLIGGMAMSGRIFSVLHHA
jgi:hypothetical protein